jgi:hypothetical protein
MATRVELGAILGVVIGVLAITVVVFAAAGGHGTYVPAVIAFPVAMLTTRFTNTISAVAVGLAVLQFPLYGVLIAGAQDAKCSRVAALILAVHVTMAATTYAFLQNGPFL